MSKEEAPSEKVSSSSPLRSSIIGHEALYAALTDTELGAAEVAEPLESALFYVNAPPEMSPLAHPDSFAAAYDEVKQNIFGKKEPPAED